MCKEYNGWSNYETWVVHLWLTNDQGTDEYVRDKVRGLNTCDACEALEVIVSDDNPLEGQASMHADMLNAAISSVNWYELAKAFKDDEDD